MYSEERKVNGGMKQRKSRDTQLKVQFCEPNCILTRQELYPSSLISILETKIITVFCR